MEDKRAIRLLPVDRLAGSLALPTVYCLLFTAHCLLPTAYCPLPTAWSGIAVLYTRDGNPRVRDPNRPVQYQVDDGTLADFSREQVINRLQAAFDTWGRVRVSCLQIKPLERLREDVTWQSFQTYRIQDVIVIDEDGSLIKNLFGSATALSGYTSWYFSRDRLEAACIVLNGQATGYREDIIVHEIGHAFGLAHYDTPGLSIPGPIMSYSPRRAMEPTWDDRLTLSWFYPAETVLQDWGKLTGRVVDWAGQPVPGGVVQVQRLDDATIAASSLSSGAGKKDGSFTFQGLPPGDYTLRLDPIPDYYSRGSGPRAYASEYAAGHPRDYGIPSEFYSGLDEGASWITDLPSKTSTVAIRPGSETIITLVRNLTLPTWEDATDVKDLNFSSPLNWGFDSNRMRGQTFIPRGSQISEASLFFDGNTEGVTGRLFLWPTNAKSQPDLSRPVFSTDPIPLEGPSLRTKLDPPVHVIPGQRYCLGSDVPTSLKLYIEENDYPYGWLVMGQSLGKAYESWDSRFVIRYASGEVLAPSLPPADPNTVRLTLPELSTKTSKPSVSPNSILRTPHSSLCIPHSAFHTPHSSAWAFNALPTEGIRLLQPCAALGDRLERVGLMVAAEEAVSGSLHLGIAGPIEEHGVLNVERELRILSSTQLSPLKRIDPQYVIWKLNPPVEVKIGELYGLLVWCESGTGRYLLRLWEIEGEMSSLIVLQKDNRRQFLGGLVMESFLDWTKQESPSSIDKMYFGG